MRAQARLDHRLAQYRAVKSKLDNLVDQHIVGNTPIQVVQKAKDEYYNVIDNINQYHNLYRALTRNGTINEDWRNYYRLFRDLPSLIPKNEWRPRPPGEPKTVTDTEVRFPANRLPPLFSELLRQNNRTITNVSSEDYQCFQRSLALSLGEFQATFGWYQIRWLTDATYWKFTNSKSGPPNESSGLSSFMLMTNLSVCVAVIKPSNNRNRFSVTLQLNFPNLDATNLDGLTKTVSFDIDNMDPNMKLNDALQQKIITKKQLRIYCELLRSYRIRIRSLAGRQMENVSVDEYNNILRSLNPSPTLFLLFDSLFHNPYIIWIAFDEENRHYRAITSHLNGNDALGERVRKYMTRINSDPTWYQISNPKLGEYELSLRDAVRFAQEDKEHNAQVTKANLEFAREARKKKKKKKKGGYFLADLLEENSPDVIEGRVIPAPPQQDSDSDPTLQEVQRAEAIQQVIDSQETKALKAANEEADEQRRELILAQPNPLRIDNLALANLPIQEEPQWSPAPEPFFNPPLSEDHSPDENFINPERNEMANPIDDITPEQIQQLHIQLNQLNQEAEPLRAEVVRLIDRTAELEQRIQELRQILDGIKRVRSEAARQGWRTRRKHAREARERLRHRPIIRDDDSDEEENVPPPAPARRQRNRGRQAATPPPPVRRRLIPNPNPDSDEEEAVPRRVMVRIRIPKKK